VLSKPSPSSGTTTEIESGGFSGAEIIDHKNEILLRLFVKLYLAG